MPAASETRPGPGRIEFILLISVVMMTVALAIDSMLPALPAMGRALGIVNENDRPIIVSVFLVGYSVMQFLAGTLVDRFGRRMPLRLGLLGYSTAGLACAMADSFTFLLTARFIQGMAAATGQVAVRAIVRDRFEGRDMAQVMSLSSMIFMFGPILAPALGQLILHIADWRWIFGMLTIAGVLIWVWVQARIVETLTPENRIPFEFDAVKASATKVVTDRISLGYSFAMGLIQAGLIGFLTSIQQIFEHGFKDPDFLPTGFALMSAGMSVASLFNAAVVKRYGMRRIGHSALIFYTIVAGIHLALVHGGYETMTVFIALQTIMMLGHSLAMGNFSAMAMENMASVAGVANSLQGTLSNIISISLGTFIGQAFNGTTQPLYTGYFVFGLIALCVVYVTEGGRFFVARHEGEGAGA